MEAGKYLNIPERALQTLTNLNIGYANYLHDDALNHVDNQKGVPGGIAELDKDGTISVEQGGTGVKSFTENNILLGNNKNEISTNPRFSICSHSIYPGDSAPSGWRRICKLTGIFPGYLNCLLFISGGYSTGAPVGAIVSINSCSTYATLKVLSSECRRPSTTIKQLKLVYESVNGKDAFWLDAYVEGNLGTMIDQTFDFIGNVVISEKVTANPAPVIDDPTTPSAICVIEPSNLGSIAPNTVAAHNNFPRGDVLTDRYSLSEILTMIEKRDYHDIFIGDKIVVPVPAIPETGFAGGNTTILVGEIESHHNYGDTPVLNNKGHILCFPETILGSAKMNATNTTEGGYVGSYMNTTIMPAVQAALESALGTEHLLSARELITINVDPESSSKGMPNQKGCSNSWAWSEKKCRLMSELEVYGSSCFSSSGYDDAGLAHQISLFRLDYKAVAILVNWWLSAVCGSTNFCSANSSGGVSSSGAGSSYGVRPRFLIG